MRSSALTVCHVLTSEQRTEPSASWNELPAGNQACSPSYGVGTATSGLEPSRGQTLLCCNPGVAPGMNLLVRNSGNDRG